MTHCLFYLNLHSTDKFADKCGLNLNKWVLVCKDRKRWKDMFQLTWKVVVISGVIVSVPPFSVGWGGRMNSLVDAVTLWSSKWNVKLILSSDTRNTLSAMSSLASLDLLRWNLSTIFWNNTKSFLNLWAVVLFHRKIHYGWDWQPMLSALCRLLPPYIYQPGYHGVRA